MERDGSAPERGAGAEETIAAGARAGSTAPPGFADTIVDTDAATVGAGQRAAPAAVVERGAVIGRYVVLMHLGTGGMGVVYAAYDPELDRRVALKLVRDVEAGEGRARLLREAQALARLSHPNVVAVHDAGVVGDRVWLAMEHVDGVSLGTWLKEHKRSWPEILQVLLAVGRGLAAAHAAGLVHRDLKPDNIMIGRDGRVRVMDFGLARAIDRAGEEPRRGAAELAAAGRVALATPLTLAGAVMGTPAYMAPEQIGGEEADARADQFAFCVTAWEALFGARPFGGGTLVELAASVLAGAIRPPPPGSRVPAWLRRALVRGLDVDPARRHASMDALLAALAHGRARRRIRRIAIGVGVAAAAVIGGLVMRGFERERRIAACEAAGAEIAAVWNDAARASLRTAMVATGVSHAGTTYEKVVPWLERWTRGWAELRAGLCVEAEVAATRPPELYARSVACLDERRDELAALLEVLGDSDASAVQLAVPAVVRLRELEPCGERSALERRPLPSPDLSARARVAELRRDLMRAEALLSAGRYAEGLERAAAVLGAGELLDYAPLAIEARSVVGRAAMGAGQFDRAEAELVRAYVDAGAIGADDLAAHAVTKLVFLVGSVRERPLEGLLWARSAELFVDRIGEDEGHPGADLLTNLAAVHTARGDHEQALALHRRALAILERMLGPEHPFVASSLNNVALALYQRGDVDQALNLFERALEIQEQALGPDDPTLAAFMGNVSVAYAARGLHERALALGERALAVQERALGREHHNVAISLNNLAELHQARGELERAFSLHTRALAIREKVLGPEHPRVADSLAGLALVSEARGALDEAQALLTRALAIRGRAATVGDRSVPELQVRLAEVSLARGAAGEAAPLLERAVSALAAAETGPGALAGARFALARALAALGRERGRARELATQAAEGYRAAGDGEALARVEAWLSESRG